MSRSFTSIATLTEAMARTLESYQVDSKEIFVSFGLTPEPFRSPDERISREVIDSVWEEAARITKNPCIGFEVGLVMHATNLHAVGYAMLASSTLKEAMERLVRYQRLLSTAADMDFFESDSEFTLQIDPAPGIDYGDDCAFTAIVQMCRDLVHEEFHPLSVHMMRPEPPCVLKLKRFFGCQVQYEADLDKIVFTGESVNEPLRRHNPALAQASEEIAQQYLANMDKHDVVARARVVIVDQLPDGEPNRKEVASELAMSERTLARRLSDRDYTFSTLVDEIRNQLAKEYLRQPRFSVTDVAFLLGFSDQSNFARAFKRWTDLSPSQFRATETG